MALKYLSEGGSKVAIYEQKLSLGGGMSDGGMMFPQIVVQEEVCGILDDFGIMYEEYLPDIVRQIPQVRREVIAGVSPAGTEVFIL
jgi:sulfide-dependent adenosine diphosphate thiazole synthase